MSQFVRKCSRILKLNKTFFNTSRILFHDETPKSNIKENLTPGNIASKYDIFRDEDSPIILDVDEEKSKYNSIEITSEIVDPMKGINLKRGLSGVFEINDLVDLLRRENAENIVVCRVPSSIKYVDYLCITTAMSMRHMNAMAQFVRKVFKHKRNSDDILPKIEGVGLKSNWIAMDLGNIAVHIFLKETRKIYDLESLWSVGKEFDKEYNKPEQAIVEMYERHSVYLSDLTPKIQKNQLS